MSPQPPEHFSALIIGSGQSGTPLATHLTSLGLSVCLVERTHIAGCCVNEGCTPTKTMVASARIAYLVGRAREFGVNVSGGRGQEKVDMLKVRQRKRDIVDSFRGGSERRVEAAGVKVVKGEGRFVGKGGKGGKEVCVRLSGGDEGGELEKRITADTVYINVGCRPSRPKLPGLETLDQSRVLDSTSIQELDEVPEHLVVLGGGYIGLEFAQVFRRLGSKVSIIHRGKRLLSRSDDPEVVDCVQGLLKDEGVEMMLDVPETSFSVSEDTELPVLVTVSTTEHRTMDIRASHLLLATGRVPNTETLGLETAGIKTTPSGHIIASPTLQTNVEDVFVMGDVKGGPAFTHVSYDDFRIIRDNLTASGAVKTEGTLKTTTTRAQYIPSVVYTDPQIAHIGPKYSDLKPLVAQGRKLVSYSMPGSWIARGLETEETRGMLKAVVDEESEKIVSFTAVSAEGGELMAVVQMAMWGGLGWKELQNMVFAHPSWSEALNNLWGGEKKVVKF
ncbi:hypothetical protein BCR34DRAFT_489556 [Clohesyomyces aquaticus]|uniref:Mercuric reductase n=1 Tax=Clohesyomyces aquaticus TaxID=1231657 RepID=A0A1Y1ZAR2_9PLEO|nr:hypothetical protein BCR34DRAFT_489556 [Clohesyomyces aquaticus]